ncbi:hypothetical protein OAY83_00685 [Candidatus Marinimicrobia bacterium]|nr:hypothetical protein [Candidatus Neomarinimicrobiota bacterium]
MLYIIAIYISIILFVGFLTRNDKNVSEFIYAGRKLTAFPLTLTLVTTWYGAISTVGQEISYNGISSWLYFSLTYYIAAIIYSEIISKLIIDRNISSISVGIFNHLGKNAAIVSLPIVLLYTSPAPYLIMLGNIINTTIFESKHYSLSLILGLLLSVIYCFKGGFKSIVNTDKFQFLFMFMGFITMTLYIIFFYDFGFTKLRENYFINPELFQIPGNQGWFYIIAWGFIAILTFIDPNFHQRTFSSKNKKEIKIAIRMSVLCWFIFDMIILFCGLYAIGIKSNTPYVSLAMEIFLDHPLLYGIFIVSILSILMSTIDSFTFVSALIIGKDTKTIFNKDFNKRDIKWGIGFTILLSIIIIQFFDNNKIIEIWFVFGSYMVSSLLIPFFCILKGIKIKYPLVLILAPLFITVYFDIMKIDWIISIYPGLITSLILMMILKKN